MGKILSCIQRENGPPMIRRTMTTIQRNAIIAAVGAELLQKVIPLKLEVVAVVVVYGHSRVKNLLNLEDWMILALDLGLQSLEWTLMKQVIVKFSVVADNEMQLITINYMK